MLLNEMARPAKICPKCGKSMSGNHYWYKGGWHCKKSNTASVASNVAPAASTSVAKGAAPSGPVVSRTAKVNSMLKGTKQVNTPAAAQATATPAQNSPEYWMKEFRIEKYTVEADGTVNTDEDVEILDKGQDKLPVKFGVVNGDFICSAAGLVSLEGCPTEVRKGDFFCDHSSITSLVGSPTKVEGSVVVGGNAITSLEGVTAHIGGELRADDCSKLTSLQGIHKYLKHVGGKVWFSDTPIDSNVLGVLLVDGLTEIKIDNIKVMEIVNKHLKGERDIHMCQQELIDGGFAEFAKL